MHCLELMVRMLSKRFGETLRGVKEGQSAATNMSCKPRISARFRLVAKLSGHT